MIELTTVWIAHCMKLINIQTVFGKCGGKLEKSEEELEDVEESVRVREGRNLKKNRNWKEKHRGNVCKKLRIIHKRKENISEEAEKRWKTFSLQLI